MEQTLEMRVWSIDWGDPLGGHGNPLQYSCLENPMDRGARQAIVHRVAELDTAEVTKPAPLKWIIYPGSDY